LVAGLAQSHYSALVSINVVNLRWARLIVGSVTVRGFKSRSRHLSI